MYNKGLTTYDPGFCSILPYEDKQNSVAIPPAWRPVTFNS